MPLLYLRVMHEFENQSGINLLPIHGRKSCNSFGKTENTSSGEVVLKSLEQYIYHHPEEWYQWKKVSEIKSSEEARLLR